MGNDLLVIVPTRGRPENVQRLEKARGVARCRRTDFIYAVDDDDPKRGDYLALGLDRITLDRRQGLCGSLNDTALRYADRYPFLGFMGDDHLPQTHQWDGRVMAALRGIDPSGQVEESEGPRIVYGNDLLQGANLPTAVFMPSRVVRALGWFAPPNMRHLYLDNFWKELGEALGTLAYLPETVIEHLHPAAGKAPMDDGYREANAPQQDSADREAWLAFKSSGGFAHAVDRVRKEYGL